MDKVKGTGKLFVFKAKDESLRPFIYLAYISILVGFLSLITSLSYQAIIVLSVSIIIAVLLSLVHNRTTLDLNRKHVLQKKFFGSTKRTSFDKITKIYINSFNQSQTISSRVSTTSVKYSVYAGFIKLNDVHKVKLSSSKNKDKVIEALMPICKAVNLEIEDRTQ